MELGVAELRFGGRGKCLLEAKLTGEAIDAGSVATTEEALSVLARGGGHLDRLALPGRDKTRMP